MRFEISEQIRTRQDRAAVVNALEIQLRKVSRKVERSGDTLTASAIEASFGSINRFDRTIVQIQRKDAGFLCVADVTYRPSVFFWIFFVMGLFAYFLLWWPPIIFYLIQRRTVRSAIADVFARVKNEFEMDTMPFRSNLTDLERLALLKANGILTETEFANQKQEILGTANVGMPSTRPVVLSPADVTLIASYLQRRFALEPDARESIARQIADRVRSQTGLYPSSGQSFDDFLQCLALQARVDTDTPGSVAPTASQCSHCGNAYDGHAKFCPNCGNARAFSDTV